jgi:hypothetical protein
MYETGLTDMMYQVEVLCLPLQAHKRKSTGLNEFIFLLDEIKVSARNMDSG